MRHKELHIGKAMVTTAKELYYTIKYSIIEDLSKLALALEICLPILIGFLGYNFIITLLISTVSVLCIRYLISLSKKLNNLTDDGIPVPIARYTKLDNDGFITLTNETELPEMLQYINELEEYFIKKGFMEDDEHRL